jgi:DNA-directed RNA polymerase subunit RPC12/RpoP
MKCGKCHQDILQDNPESCPYCGSKTLLSDEDADKMEIREIEKLERTGKYEEAAARYEALEMWDKAGDCRRRAKPSHVVQANLSVAKVGAISMVCPHCGGSQSIASKSGQVTCKRCGKAYAIPKKVFDLV